MRSNAWPCVQGDISLKDCLQKRIRTEVSCRGKHLGCRYWANMGLRYGLSGNRVPVLATYRQKDERETASTGDGRFFPGKTNPT